MSIYRYDEGEIKKTFKNDDGFLRADAVVTRTGVFRYINKDGTIRRELRHPDHVFNKDSMESLKMIPVTKMHPKEKIVNSDNSKKLKVGSTGETVRRDGDLLRSTLVVNDQDAIEGIESKKIQELSLGYTLELVEESGVFNGDEYDFIQTNIKYNHLALVPNARAGAIARIALDSEDAMIYNEIDDPNSGGDNNNPKKEKDMTMVKVNADNGIAYECAPEIANFLKKESSRADSSESSLKEVSKERETIQANLDEANAKIKKIENVDHSEIISKGVKSRLTLEKSAIERLDEKELKNLDSMTDKDIQIAIIKKSDSEFNADGKSEDYMTARFDASMLVKPEMKPTDKQKPSLKDGKRVDGDRTSEQARLDMEEETLNAWKSK